MKKIFLLLVFFVLATNAFADNALTDDVCPKCTEVQFKCYNTSTDDGRESMEDFCGKGAGACFDPTHCAIHMPIATCDTFGYEYKIRPGFSDSFQTEWITTSSIKIPDCSAYLTYLINRKNIVTNQARYSNNEIMELFSGCVAWLHEYIHLTDPLCYKRTPDNPDSTIACREFLADSTTASNYYNGAQKACSTLTDPDAGLNPDERDKLINLCYGEYGLCASWEFHASSRDVEGCMCNRHKKQVCVKQEDCEECVKEHCLGTRNPGGLPGISIVATGVFIDKYPPACRAVKVPPESYAFLTTPISGLDFPYRNRDWAGRCNMILNNKDAHGCDLLAYTPPKTIKQASFHTRDANYSVTDSVQCTPTETPPTRPTTTPPNRRPVPTTTSPNRRPAPITSPTRPTAPTEAPPARRPTTTPPTSPTAPRATPTSTPTRTKTPTPTGTLTPTQTTTPIPTSPTSPTNTATPTSTSTPTRTTSPTTTGTLPTTRSPSR